MNPSSEPIQPLETAVAAFVGQLANGPENDPIRVRSFDDVERTFGGLDGPGDTALALRQFFLNGGQVAYVVRTGRGPIALAGNAAARTGLHALLDLDPYAVSLICLPDAASFDARGRRHAYATAARLAELQRAFLLCDLPPAASDPSAAIAWVEGDENPRTPNGAVYFPRLVIPGMRRQGKERETGPSGTVAGIIARNDAARGIWKAPAGKEATIVGALPAVELLDSHARALNPRAINPIRTLPTAGPVLWGARTLKGDDSLNDEFKYISVRRLVLHIERSVHRGLSWVVFEDNGRALWDRVGSDVYDFLHLLWREGAFQGAKPEQAFYVKMGLGETMTQADIDAGRLIILIGIAPLKPAEFVHIRIDLQTR